MLFSSPAFCVFFFAYLCLHLLVPARHRIYLIIAGSTVFYAWWRVEYTWLPYLLMAIAYGGVRWMEGAPTPAARKERAAIAIVVLFVPLLVFKYTDFVYRDVLGPLFGWRGTLLNLPLPLGVSFVTFTLTAYIVDIYRKRYRFDEPATTVLGYVLFFPHLIAGPILRPRELMPQLDRPRSTPLSRFAVPLALFTIGLVKKLVFADQIADAVDTIYRQGGATSGPAALLAIYGFSVQIYCDFSGYTDMAIGLALLLGFRFPQNFDSPYTAISIQDFWRRWHMTLSRWLRDYVYIPLGGNRKGEPRTYLNLMATMLIGGLWHGAAWSFVIWGGLHGSWLAIGRWRRERGHMVDATSGWGLWRQRIGTFALVSFAWIFFRAGSESGLSTAWQVIKRLFDNWGAASPLLEGRAGLGIALAILVGIGTQYLPARIPQSIMAWFSRRQVVVQVVVLALALMVSRTMGPQGVAPFIYFRF